MLKKLRLKSKLTQEKLAFLTGLSVKTISSIENGKECNKKRQLISCLLIVRAYALYIK